MWNLCRAPLRRSLVQFRSTVVVPRFNLSSAAVAKQEEYHDDDAVEQPKAEIPPRAFAELKNAMSAETFKAITETPFTHVNMTAAQEKVLSHLPGLTDAFNPDATTPQVRDLLVRARTGTGKTLAFLVPIIEARRRRLIEHAEAVAQTAGRPEDASIKAAAMTSFRQNNVGALIISPTRELATQIANEALKLSSHHKGFQAQLLVGGSHRNNQIRSWAQGSLDVVVATPGRLLDILHTEPRMVEQLKTAPMLVVDEADTLLEMGFRDDLDAIIRHVQPKPYRQTLMFSATVSPAIRQITRLYLDANHDYIDCVGNTEPVHMRIPQYATTLPSAEAQIPHVIKLIIQDQLLHPGKSKVIVFLSTTKMTQLFSSFLRNLSRDLMPAGRSTEVYEIHSKLTQGTRTNSSDRFRAAQRPSILVTSDVSARGVDYPGVTRVIQIGIPASKDQYVHRVGRTGRGANNTGRGDLVLLPFEVGFLTWQLTEMPLKALTISELHKQLGDLGAKYDANREEVIGINPSAMRTYAHPVQPMIDDVESRIKTLTSRIDEEAVRVTFLSQLGYYLAKAPELRIQKEVILEGLRTWTVEACGLSEPPYASPGFLREMGLSDGRTKHWGDKSVGSRSRASRSSPWAGRGTQRTRDAPHSTFDGSEPLPLEEGEHSSYRGQRYGAQEDIGGRKFGSGQRGYRGRSEGSSGGYRGTSDGSSGGYRGRSSEGGSSGYRGRSDSGSGGYRGRSDGGSSGYRGRSDGSSSGYRGRDSGRGSRSFGDRGSLFSARD